jgi:integrase
MGVKVREKPKGSNNWWVFIDHQGRRKAKKVGKNKRVALDVAKRIEAKLVLGELHLSKEPENQAPSFEEYATTWMTLNVPATCKPSTEKDYRSILDNHVLPAFGKKPVTEIKRMMIKKFLMKKIKSGYAASTVSHMKSCIGGALNVAVDDGVLMANPAHRLGKISKKRDVQSDIKPYSRDELASLLDSFQTHFPVHYPQALTLARTGMRLGEALALQWDDIDFEGRSITIQRTFSRGKIGLPKNGKRRRIDMSKQLTQVLKDTKHQRKIETINNGWGKVPEWVFVSNTGTALDINHWRKRVFYKAIEKAELRKIRVHDIRHTYASLLIQAGESLAYVRDQLGHHSISVTVDIYGHLTPGGNKDAVDRLDDLDADATIRNLSATNKKRASQ